LKIRDLSIGSARVKVEGKVVNKSEPKTVKLWDGRNANVADALLEDGSGSIILSLWNEADRDGDIGDKVQIVNGYVSNFKKEKRLNLGRYGKIIKV